MFNRWLRRPRGRRVPAEPPTDTASKEMPMATQLSSSDASPAPQALRGIGVSPGVAAGPALAFRPPLPADAPATASRTASVGADTRKSDRRLATGAEGLPA